jgi:hypothetical protein
MSDSFESLIQEYVKYYWPVHMSHQPETEREDFVRRCSEQYDFHGEELLKKHLKKAKKEYFEKYYNEKVEL